MEAIQEKETMNSSNYTLVKYLPDKQINQNPSFVIATWNRSF